MSPRGQLRYWRVMVAMLAAGVIISLAGAASEFGHGYIISSGLMSVCSAGLGVALEYTWRHKP